MTTKAAAEQVGPLIAQLGFFDRNDTLLLQALTHRSYANDHACPSNERLEFLGDSVLSLVLSDYLYHKCANRTEGELSKLRATLVNEDFLLGIAKKLNLGAYLRLGSGERKTGGQNRPSILADAVEALIGAIYLEYGLEACARFILSLWEGSINRFLAEGRPIDAKTTLQELTQKSGKKPEYRLIKIEGPDHLRRFTVEVFIDGQSMGTGTGHSKKEAEQNAANFALKNLQGMQDI
ncbi:MAG TPA: ribonuclease III [Bacillota bacterium]|nr:ribonuclease III [Bacillota bacterium]HPT67536.1 ribonuclease III [Bacillota bacterium]